LSISLLSSGAVSDWPWWRRWPCRHARQSVRASTVAQHRRRRRQAFHPTCTRTSQSCRLKRRCGPMLQPEYKLSERNGRTRDCRKQFWARTVFGSRAFCHAAPSILFQSLIDWLKQYTRRRSWECIIIFPFLVISARLTPGRIITGLSRLAFWDLLETETEDWPAQTIQA